MTSSSVLIVYWYNNLVRVDYFKLLVHLGAIALVAKILDKLVGNTIALTNNRQIGWEMRSHFRVFMRRLS
ncbi:hypothetical protein [Synechocystis sp. PCC 7509]|uniref:hypothetical protein n=1 Tax=Synechocystis sp. PCC 7509 TaxID=927677 RepID=UPI0011DE3424|nr:hypothetical protein [Synechocystis sp. PCC 7509]